MNRYNEMMGLIGMGNNPMVGATVAVAVSVSQALAAQKQSLLISKNRQAFGLVFFLYY